MAPEPQTETLGTVLKRARTGLKLSLRAVERRTGIRSGHLSQIETDTIGRPEMAILWELASLYGLEFPQLAALAGYAAGDDGSAGQRRRMTVALRALGELSPREQEAALAYMAELKGRRARG